MAKGGGAMLLPQHIYMHLVLLTKMPLLLYTSYNARRGKTGKDTHGFCGSRKPGSLGDGFKESRQTLDVGTCLDLPPRP